MTISILKYLGILALSFVLISQVAQAGLLEVNTVGEITNNTGAVQVGAGYSAGATLGSVVAVIIKGFLGVLGIIFVILMIVAGFNWMTAAGEEEKINKAKDTLRAAIIGLIIVVSAYAITYFVFENLPGSGTSIEP